MGITRRQFMQAGAGGLAALAWPAPSSARPVRVLSVAYAGSMGALMHGGVAPVMAHRFQTRIEGRAQGALGLAHMIVGGAIRPDVFISITRAPMDIVLRAGKAREAFAIASTELVIAYSPRSPLTPAFQVAQVPGHAAWWKILEARGARFGRTDPATDPQGLNIIFMMKLAERFYHQPGLVERILGPVMNARQIFPEPEVMTRLQAGQLDASSAYKTQPAALGLPYLTLPAAINLGEATEEPIYDSVSVRLQGKIHRPSPLVFYAAVLKDSGHPKASAHLIDWFRGPSGQEILHRYHYDGPKGAAPLTV